MSSLHAVEPSHVWQEHGQTEFMGVRLSTSYRERADVCICVSGKRGRYSLKVRRLEVRFFLSLFRFLRLFAPPPTGPEEVTFRGYCYLKWQQIQCVQCCLGCFGPCDLAVRQTGCQSSQKRRRKNYPADWWISAIWMFNQNWSQLDAPVLP